MPPLDALLIRETDALVDEVVMAGSLSSAVSGRTCFAGHYGRASVAGAWPKSRPLRNCRRSLNTPLGADPLVA